MVLSALVSIRSASQDVNFVVFLPLGSSGDRQHKSVRQQPLNFLKIRSVFAINQQLWPQKLLCGARTFLSVVDATSKMDAAATRPEAKPPSD